jgi:hypothetical protein
MHPSDAGKYSGLLGALLLPNLPQKTLRRLAQRNDVIALLLGRRMRLRPGAAVEVDLIPCRVDDLAAPVNSISRNALATDWFEYPASALTSRPSSAGVR